MDPIVGVILVAVVVMVVLATGVLARGGIAPWIRGMHGHGDVRDSPVRVHPIADAAALDALFTASHIAPAILFLHDPGCSISRAAYRHMMRLDAAFPLIDVRHAHALSRAVEERTGVRHESPQAFVLRHGQAVWSAAHDAITADAITGALQQAGEEAS